MVSVAPRSRTSGCRSSQSDEQDQAPRAEGGEKAGRRHAFRLFPALCAELARDVVARALPEEEADRLYERHQRKHHADRAGRARSQPPHEKRVRHVVNGRNQHTDDGRNGHFADERLDRDSVIWMNFCFCASVVKRNAPFARRLIYKS